MHLTATINSQWPNRQCIIQTLDTLSLTRSCTHLFICGHVSHLSMQMICFTCRSDIFQTFKSHNIWLFWHWNSVASFFYCLLARSLACLFVRFGLNWILFLLLLFEIHLTDVNWNESNTATDMMSVARKQQKKFKRKNEKLKKTLFFF